MKILVTKTLTKNQRNTFIEGIEPFEKNFITTNTINFEVPTRKTGATIFTSQNAVNSVSKKISVIENDILCVGEKTAQSIRIAFKKEPLIIKNSSEELGNEITLRNYESITFFNGNLRRKEIPIIIRSKNIDLEEVMVYKTNLTPHKIKTKFDGILFFSPSGVESFLKNNSFSENTTIFAIGSTTAQYIDKNNDQCIVSQNPTIESTIEAVNKYFYNK